MWWCKTAPKSNYDWKKEVNWQEVIVCDREFKEKWLTASRKKVKVGGLKRNREEMRSWTTKFSIHNPSVRSPKQSKHLKFQNQSLFFVIGDVIYQLIRYMRMITKLKVSGIKMVTKMVMNKKDLLHLSISTCSSSWGSCSTAVTTWEIRSWPPPCPRAYLLTSPSYNFAITLFSSPMRFL